MQAASPELTADAILQRYKTVTGGAAWDMVRTIHVKVEFSGDGTTGSAEQWIDALNGRKRSSNVMGGACYADGFDGKQAWTKHGADPAVPNDGPAEQQDAISVAYQSCNAYWYPDRLAGSAVYVGQTACNKAIYDIVDIAPDGGTPFQMWFDDSTGLLGMTVEQHAMDSTTYLYSKYRPVKIGDGDGDDAATVLMPFAIRISNGSAQDDTVLNRRRLEINTPAPDDAFAMPSGFVPDYSIKSGASSVTVPFYYINNHIFVPIKINGNSAYALFDTGGRYVISPATAYKMGLLSLDNSSSDGSSGNDLGVNTYSYNGNYHPGIYYGTNGAGAGGGGDAQLDFTGVVQADNIEIGDLKIKQPLLQMNPNFSSSRALAIVGAELLDRFVVSLNFDTSTITLTCPEAFHYSGAGTIVPFHFHEGRVPLVEGSVDGMAGTFTIDTGDNRGLTLNGPFNLTNNLLDKYKPKFTAISGYGLRGADEAYVIRTKTLTVGGATVHDRVTYLRGGSFGPGADRFVSGSIGNEALHEFNIIFDYPRERIILEPNKQYGEPDFYQRTGIIFDLYKSEPTVAEVIPGSPADRAGLAPGDTIECIDGVKAKDKDAADKFRDFNYEPAGSSVVLQYKHPKGKIQTVTIVLRDLV